MNAEGRRKYSVIAEELERELGQWKEPFLPSQRSLAQRFGVNRRTVQQALDRLESEGLIIRVEGRGYGLAKKPLRSHGKALKVGYPVWVNGLADIDLSSPYAQSRYILEAIKSELERFGFELDIQFVGPQSRPDWDKIRRLCDEWSAVIVEPFQHAREHRVSLGEDYPFAPLRNFMVVIGNIQGGKYNCVYPDIYGGTQRAVDYLVERGASHIFFTGEMTDDTPNLLLRVAGAQEAVARRRHVELSFGRSSVTATGGYSAVKSALQEGIKFDAVIANSCYAAMGAMGALREANIAIGQEVQLISLGSLPIMRYYAPRPTAVEIDIGEVGREAASMAKDLILNGGTPLASRIVSTVLIPQETTKFPGVESGSGKQGNMALSERKPILENC